MLEIKDSCAHLLRSQQELVLWDIRRFIRGMTICLPGNLDQLIAMLHVHCYSHAPYTDYPGEPYLLSPSNPDLLFFCPHFSGYFCSLPVSRFAHYNPSRSNRKGRPQPPCNFLHTCFRYPSFSFFCIESVGACCKGFAVIVTEADVCLSCQAQSLITKANRSLRSSLKPSRSSGVITPFRSRASRFMYIFDRLIRAARLICC